VRIRSVFNHSAQVIAEGALISVLAIGLVAGSALAAKPSAGGTGGGKHGGGGTGSGSLALVMVTDANQDGSPNWGDTVTFAVTSTSAYPTVDLTCSQGGVLVYSASAGFYASYPWPGARNMPLSSPSWSGAAAACTAVLNGGAATLKFTANA
jgi:hypothetical protein